MYMIATKMTMRNIVVTSVETSDITPRLCTNSCGVPPESIVGGIGITMLHSGHNGTR